MSKYYIEVTHRELNKYQVIRGNDKAEVERRARAKAAQWDDMWIRKQAANEARLQREQRAKEKEQKLALASERTTEAQAEITALEGTLLYALGEGKFVFDWESLKDHSPYPKSKPVQSKAPREPKQSEPKYQPKLGLMDMVFDSRSAKKRRDALYLFRKDYEEWLATKERIQLEHLEALANWEKAKEEYHYEQDKNNATIDNQKRAFYAKEESDLLEYFDTALSASKYPDYFPQTFELDYEPTVGRIVIEYQLPDSTTIPTLKEVRYIQTRDEFKEYHLTEGQFNKLYDDLLYQIALRTIYELFEADIPSAITQIIFNGYVTAVDPATGQNKTACILSIQTSRHEFQEINLENIDPKTCFRNLKGISSSKLHELTPVAPILKIDREDGRFVSSYDVVDNMGADENLAAMDWEDFEHLVREVFEKEFASSGGEVKVTRASRDGGIDAVAFDPDPIRGGKIVIQAKRYTNTVGVSAVRDLYGSLMNEGATKGILVTTSDYGPDAHEFAKGKPLTLLNGSNLLYLLEKHGYKAKIDVKEAKRVLAEKNNG